MRKIVGWLLTIPYLIIFFTTLVLWHPLIVCSYYLGLGCYRAIIALGNGTLLLELKLIGTRVSFEGLELLPHDRPLIIVANHQSLYDIPLLLWILRRRKPGFIAKQELGRNIPSVSHALRNMGSALIDRSDAASAIGAIEEFGKRMNDERRAAIIFPEGTRAKNGHMKRFKLQGLQALARSMPDAVITPVSISGSWHLTSWKMRPVYPGASIRVRFLPPLELSAIPPAELADEIESRIRATLPPREAAPPPRK